MQEISAASLCPPAVIQPDSLDIQLLVLDIDGTIAGESNQVSQPVLEAIQAVQAKGISVAIATGRMYCSALRFHQAIASPLPLVAYQGALIRDPVTETVHRHWAVPEVLAHQLLDYFEQPHLRSQLSVHFYVGDQLYVRELTPETLDYAARSAVTPIPVGDLRPVLRDQPTKVLALSHDVDLIEDLLQTLRQRYAPTDLYLTKSVPTFFEAANPKVNKGTAVRYLAEELLGIQPQHVMAVGDNWNDLEMLTYAGMGIAMGSAPLSVQSVAQWVAPTVEEDGVAAAIKTFLL
ncbi:hydrolase [Neosynechococcus sphagnicola sy1]|uniref:Hydrolase n=1 Tax=Neosynechococcus sphagnicola sy1 TaxID=1497020 RepID=A0A098TNE7_9CYAN|nr:Cof-type HAD-IIB family hydrolase [Neosynechococcus sphagnicola]KGF73392.1 hydrolase [Neosynechococcus sphagnicola sy1]